MDSDLGNCRGRHTGRTEDNALCQLLESGKSRNVVMDQNKTGHVPARKKQTTLMQLPAYGICG